MLVCPNNHKLDFWSKRCIFLGYSFNHKGYKCLDSSTNCMYIAHNIVFDEMVFSFATRHPISENPTHPSPHTSLLNLHLPGRAAPSISPLKSPNISPQITPPIYPQNSPQNIPQISPQNSSKLTPQRSPQLSPQTSQTIPPNLVLFQGHKICHLSCLHHLLHLSPHLPLMF